jgi:hypothetical protein
MVECSHCHSYSHLLCYGYQSIKDESIPLEFQCADCQELSIPRQEAHMMALKRKALYFMNSNSCLTVPQMPIFADKIEASLQDMEPIFKWLQDEHYINQKTDKVGRKRYYKTASKQDLEKLLDPNYFYQSKDKVYKKRKVSVVQKDLAVL